MSFLERTRPYKKTMELSFAVERAMDGGIHEGVLSDFLQKKTRVGNQNEYF